MLEGAAVGFHSLQYLPSNPDLTEKTRHGHSFFRYEELVRQGGVKYENG